MRGLPFRTEDLLVNVRPFPINFSKTEKRYSNLLCAVSPGSSEATVMALSIDHRVEGLPGFMDFKPDDRIKRITRRFHVHTIQHVRNASVHAGGNKADDF